MAESQAGSALGGCLGLIGLLVIGGCVFGGGGNEEKATASAVSNSTAPSSVEDTALIAAAEEPKTPTPKAVAISETDQSVDGAEHVVSGAIRSLGYPCARITYLTQMQEGTPLYGVTCRKRGAGEVHYLIDLDANSVTRLRG